MQFSLFNVLAPHYCISCDSIGAILCERCKHDIVNEIAPQCLRCNKPLSLSTMECATCQLPYRKVWCTGVLGDSLKALIYAAKFERNNQALVTLAEILDNTVSVLPQDITVTYIPTIRSHIRQRGYDHARTLAERFASRRTLPTATTLERTHSTVQRGANRATRRKQADIAFTVTRRLKGSYLLIDDVSTTGATIEAGAREIMAAGATEVWVAVLAHQPLESEPKN